MIDVSHRTLDQMALQNGEFRITASGFSIAAMVIDFSTILALSAMSGLAYHLFAYGTAGTAGYSLWIGGIVATLFVAGNIGAKRYDVFSYLSSKSHLRVAFTMWNAAFLGLFAIAFLSKTSDLFSRGGVGGFYLAGLLGVLLLRTMYVQVIQTGTAVGRVAARRILLIGSEADLFAFERRFQPSRLGLEVVDAVVLRELPGGERFERFDAGLKRVIARARSLNLDEVFILVPWSEKEIVDRCIEAFTSLPVTIHLGPEQIIERFEDVRIARVGPLASLEVMRPPLTLVERAAKRSLDILAAGVGLIALAPLFIAVAIAIRIEGPGPVFFLQRRLGFNQKPFRIFKFRTMTVLEDGDQVRQATKSDNRITRVGAFLRRWNIDELPQLLNVLFGDMSLVGPRPHALAHDRDFEERIALYARRSNVKPGITGWAQVNGWRGETDTDEKIRGRVAHDLYYIDNWSIWLDLYIIAATVLSARGYRNAY
ncbi:MAG: undecaprenyl-phosphate glucose phosphotransferase [Hyphomicrobiales bacterium]